MKNRIPIMTILILSIPLFALLNLTIGSVAIPVNEVFKILFGSEDINADSVNALIVLKTRLPQTLTALVCGAGLSVAGLEMQTVFHNPLAGPSVLGISSAASLGVAFVVLLSGSIFNHSDASANIAKFFHKMETIKWKKHLRFLLIRSECP